MPTIIRKRAERDLAEIADFIAKDNTVRAMSFVNELIDCCLAIEEHPTLARIRPEIGKGIRLSIYGSYVVIYRIEGDDVVILRVVHGARDIGGMRLDD